MELQETNVKLRKLTADEGKIIVSKETRKDGEGIEIPVVKAKEIYLGKEDSANNYIEIEESEEKDGKDRTN